MCLLLEFESESTLGAELQRVAYEEAKNGSIFKIQGNLQPFNWLLSPTFLLSNSGAGT